MTTSLPACGSSAGSAGLPSVLAVKTEHCQSHGFNSLSVILGCSARKTEAGYWGFKESRVLVPSYFPARVSRSIGRVIILALAVSLLMVSPATTSAQSTDPTPDYLASFDACPEEVIPDAEFEDVPISHDNLEDIDCIAYYGITKGTSPTTYSPDRPVIREHMALFLIRLARLVGIYVPSGGSTPFVDIGDLTQESQEAIAQIYRMGITIGTSPNTYTPGRNVSRGEMALFLQRLMDLMEVVEDRNDAFGYIPDDVDDNDGDFDVEAPFRDLDDVPHAVNDAVTHLYELGVASGLNGSTRTYGDSVDMSRAAMAEFMAAILDHSNLRPRGILVQLSPSTGVEDYEVTALISVRDDTFAPVEDQAVDWFYTADSEDGGLENNGECDDSEIIRGDCEWDDDDDDLTNRDGNIFTDFDAVPGETVTFYAWTGRRDGDEFDEDSAEYSKAEARSDKGAAAILVRHDIPVNAFLIDDTTFLVDMDRHSSIEFTLQLQDENGNSLEREDVAIEIEVESSEISVDATDLSGDRPDPDYVNFGRDSIDEFTVFTDRDGEATFELEGPSRDERLDEVTFEMDCCRERVRIVWSDRDPVLVTARPDFDLYQHRSSDGDLEFTVQYTLYDQYGTELHGTTASYTGRGDSVEAEISYTLHPVTVNEKPNAPTTYSVQSATSHSPSVHKSRGRFRIDVEETGLGSVSEYLVVVDPDIYSGDANDRITYEGDPVLVWIVENADDAEDYPADGELNNTNNLDTVLINEVELYPADRRFRTFFTLWHYGSNDRFRDDNGEEIGVDRFEQLWEERVDGVGDLDVLIYNGIGYFIIK